MQDYVETNPPMEIKVAGHNTLFGTAQGILLVVVRDTQGVCRTCQIADRSCARSRTESIF